MSAATKLREYRETWYTGQEIANAFYGEYGNIWKEAVVNYLNAMSWYYFPV
jgi:hypothetical protein